MKSGLTIQLVLQLLLPKNDWQIICQLSEKWFLIFLIDVRQVRGSRAKKQQTPNVTRPDFHNSKVSGEWRSDQAASGLRKNNQTHRCRDSFIRLYDTADTMQTTGCQCNTTDVHARAAGKPSRAILHNEIKTCETVFDVRFNLTGVIDHKSCVTTLQLWNKL